MLNVMLAAAIAWTVSGSTQNESDVRTDGELLYAYAPEETTVNSVTFKAVPDGRKFPDDISFAVPVNSIKGAYWNDDKSLWRGSGEYKKFFSNGFYSPRVFTKGHAILSLSGG